MKILLTNDDGFKAAGINEVFNTLLDNGYDVTIIAPESNCSGAGHSIAVYSPITIHKFTERVYYVTSTPADSVRLGLQYVYKDPENYPDLVISGVNMGENLSEDIHYSGTVGAAREGVLNGISGIAFSTPGPEFNHLKSAANVVLQLVNSISKNKNLLSEQFLWNVNIPNTSIENIKGFQSTHLGRRELHLPLEKQITPRGQTVYWQGDSGPVKSSEINTDVMVAKIGDKVSITPLVVYPTDEKQFLEINKIINIGS